MWSGEFWLGTAERAVKTLAQTMLSMWLVGDKMFNIFQIDLMSTLGVGLGAALLSVLTSLASAPIGQPNDPSAVKLNRHER